MIYSFPPENPLFSRSGLIYVLESVAMISVEAEQAASTGPRQHSHDLDDHSAGHSRRSLLTAAALQAPTKNNDVQS